MKPRPRVKLNGVSSKNQSLQDILGTCTIADEVISVVPVVNALHNTKLTLKKPDGEQRVHFYNRLDIANIIPADFRPSGDLQNDIKKLNVLGCDFNEDDLTVSNRRFVALPESLGYYGGIIDRIFTDSITFGVKNLVELSGGKDWSRKVSNIGISINGVVKEAAVNYARMEYGDNDPLYQNPTQCLISAIVDLLEDEFSYLEVTVEEAYWLENTNQRIDNEISGIITVKNLHPDNAIEMTIQAWCLQDLDSDGIYLNGYHSILPITRLEKRGANKVNAGLPSMVSLYMSDVVPMNDWWPRPEDDSEEAAVEFGKLLQINGATRSNLMTGSYIEGNTLPEVSLCVPTSGVTNLMRVITIGSSGWDDRMPVGHFINLLPQEIKLESFLNYEPLILGPAPLAGLADRVFLHNPNISADVSSENSNIILEINDDSYSISAENIYINEIDVVFANLLDEYPELMDKIIFTLLGDQTNSDEWVYFQNITDVPMRISLYWKNDEGIVLNYYPSFILEPLDTLKGSYELGTRKNTTQYNPRVAQLFNSGDLQTVTWRGVTTDFQYERIGMPFDSWIYSVFGAVIDAARTYTMDTEEEVVEYFYSVSPFLEEFIFNEGMEDEVSFQLTPMLLTRCYQYT